MSEVGKLWVSIGANTDKLEKGLKNTQDKLQSAGKKMQKTGLLMTAGITAPIVAATAVIGKLTKEAVGFEGQMNEVFTLLPGMSKQAMGAMSADVLEFAKNMGVIPQEIAPALYQAISAGVPQDNVFSFLETAQKAAVGGVTDLTTAVDGISTVVNSYGADIMDATKASDLMFTAVRLGKTTFEELAGSLFQVLPSASALGVSFEEVTAAMASMTAQGVPTSVATTQMRQLLVELSKAGGTAAVTFEQIAGKTFKDFIASGGNVADALALMEEHAQKTGVGVNDLFSSVEAGNAALALSGENAQGYINNLNEMKDAAGATEAAYAQMEEGVGRQMEKLKAEFAAARLEIGSKFLPVLTKTLIPILRKHLIPAVEKIVDFLTGMVDGFNALSPEMQANKLKWVAIAAAAGPVLMILGKLITSFKAILSVFTPLKAGLAAIAGAKGLAGVGTAATAAGTATGSALTGLLGPIALVVAGLGLLGYTFYKEWQAAKEHSERGAKHVAESLAAVKREYSDTYIGIEAAQQESNIARIDEEIAYFNNLEKLTEEQTGQLVKLQEDRQKAIASVEKNKRFDRLIAGENFGYAYAGATEKDSQQVIDAFDSFSESYLASVKEHHYNLKMEQIRALYGADKITLSQARRMIQNVNDTWKNGIIPATNASMALWLHEQGISLHKMGLMFDQELGKIVPITRQHLEDYYAYMDETGTIISMDAWALIGAKGAEGLLSAEGKIFYSAEALAKAAIKGLDIPGYNIGMGWGLDINAGLKASLATMIATARMMSAEVRAAFGDVNYSASTSYQPASGFNKWPGFDKGGIVPGPIGKPQLALVHGGETILPTHKAGMGATIINNFDIEKMQVRDEQDVEKIAHELYRLQSRRDRGVG